MGNGEVLFFTYLRWSQSCFFIPCICRTNFSMTFSTMSCYAVLNPCNAPYLPLKFVPIILGYSIKLKSDKKKHDTDIQSSIHSSSNNHLPLQDHLNKLKQIHPIVNQTFSITLHLVVWIPSPNFEALSVATRDKIVC